MKVVIDNNIFVSAFGWGGKPGLVIKRIIKELDTLFVTDDIINEVEKTFNKPEFKKPKYNMTQSWIDSVIKNIEKLAHKITVSPEHKATDVCRDSDDNIYLECAIAANVDYIISGDKHLRELGEYKGVKIVNANDYLEIVNS